MLINALPLLDELTSFEQRESAAAIFHSTIRNNPNYNLYTSLTVLCITSCSFHDKVNILSLKQRYCLSLKAITLKRLRYFKYWDWINKTYTDSLWIIEGYHINFIYLSNIFLANIELHDERLSNWEIALCTNILFFQFKICSNIAKQLNFFLFKHNYQYPCCKRLKSSTENLNFTHIQLFRRSWKWKSLWLNGGTETGKKLHWKCNFKQCSHFFVPPLLKLSVTLFLWTKFRTMMLDSASYFEVIHIPKKFSLFYVVISWVTLSKKLY